MRPIRIFIGIIGLIVAFLLIAGILLVRQASQGPTTTLESLSSPSVGILVTTPSQTSSKSTDLIPDPNQNPLQPTNTATSTAAAIAEPQQTNPPSNPAVATSSPTAQANLAASSTPGATRTKRPTSTHTTVPSPTTTPTRTPTVTSTATPVLGSITGRITYQGVPVNGGLVLALEDVSSNEIGRTSVGMDGSFTFASLPAVGQGYSVVFAQEWNSQFDTEQVLSWAWIGPIAFPAGSHIQLPDFDISLLGFGQTAPAADLIIPANEITQDTPLLFTWSAYPGAIRYWVDLARGDEQNRVWQSRLTSTNSSTFDGKFTDGTSIYVGEYWWAVGAQGGLGEYPLTIYGYLLRFIVYP